MLRLAVSGNASIDEYYRVKKIPGADEAQEVIESFWKFGGAATNVAVASAKLGCYTRYLGLVGTDHYGDSIIEELRRNDVDTNYVKRLSLPTGRVLIILDTQGRRAMLAIRGANKELKPGVFQVDGVLKSVNHLHLSSTKPEYSEWILHEAKERGLTTSYDPGMTVAYHGLKNISGPLKYTDVLFVNEKEYQALGGEEVLKKFKGLVVLKMGEKGSSFPREKITVDAFKIKAIDTTGAGDAFDAAFLLCWKKVGARRECLVFANAVGALKATKIGAHSSPTMDEVKTFLKERGFRDIIKL